MLLKRQLPPLGRSVADTLPAPAAGWRLRLATAPDTSKKRGAAGLRGVLVLEDAAAPPRLKKMQGNGPMNSSSHEDRCLVSY